MAKNNHMSNRMRRNYHEMAERIRELEAQVADAGRAREIAVNDAVESARVLIYQPQIDTLAGWLDENKQLLHDAGARIDDLTDKLTTANTVIAELTGAVTALTPYKATVEGFAVAVAAIDNTIAQVQTLVTQATDRMRRRERDEASALLNRVAVARALLMPVPETVLIQINELASPDPTCRLDPCKEGVAWCTVHNVAARWNPGDRTVGAGWYCGVSGRPLTVEAPVSDPCATIQDVP